ncbi:hypothetical protein [Nocardia sp. AG03]|uniref:hypothetical protein n=1 Tax=Nocardia sp. AG03 TaxID=3025312 RepID=UPI00241848C2|nr:hypothetical protein [Nocardia sp. AG03]
MGEFFETFVVTPLRTGWGYADRHFRPRGLLVARDEVVDQLAATRTWVGLGINIAVGMNLARFSFGDMLGDAVMRTALAALLIGPICALVMGVLLLCTHAELRRSTARDLAQPLLAMGTFAAVLGALALTPTVFEWLAEIGRSATVMKVVLTVIVVVGTPLGGLVLSAYLVRGGFLIATHAFRASDGHPLLGPIAITLTTWAVVVVELAEPSSALPTGIRLVLVLGGAATATALAVTEGYRLHRVHGFTLRSGSRPWFADAR